MLRVNLAILTFFVSISNALAAGGGTGQAPGLVESLMNIGDMGGKLINFIILLILLHLFAKKPLTTMLSNSAKQTKELAEQRLAQLTQAKKDLDEYKAKVAGLEQELAERQEKSMAAIEEEKNRLIQEAEAAAKRIEEQTQARIEQDVLKAKADIRDFLAQESADLAEELLKKKVDKQEQKGLMEGYSKVLQEL